jgi:hypothetical protein
MLFVIYDNTALWEKDFIYNDLIHNNKFIEIDIKEITMKIKKRKEIVGNNIFIFSSNKYNKNDILKIILSIKPKIIFHLSDEWGTKPEYQELSKYTNILFRQYYHGQYPNYNNIYNLPLGYTSGFFNKNYMNIELLLSENRKYIWSFIGDKKKKDRPDMIKNMTKLEPYFNNKNNKIFNNKTEIREIYRNSIFVPGCRGWNLIENFRLYEAASCGAIPIIVGTKNERLDLLNKECNPPWLEYNTWDEALNGCKELLKNMKELNERSKQNIYWWRNRINEIKNLVNQHL